MMCKVPAGTRTELTRKHKIKQIQTALQTSETKTTLEPLQLYTNMSPAVAGRHEF